MRPIRREKQVSATDIRELIGCPVALFTTVISRITQQKCTERLGRLLAAEHENSKDDYSQDTSYYANQDC